MKNIWPIRLAIVSVLVVGAWLSGANTTLAADYVFRSFTSSMEIFENGSVAVQEVITVHFPAPRHGIYRVIPTLYEQEDGQVRQLMMSQVYVTNHLAEPVPFTISNADALSLRIGDPNVTVDGEQTYVVNYVVSGAINSFDDLAELYWNVTGSEWETAPEEVITTVQFPRGQAVRAEDLSLACYTGVDQSTARDCEIRLDERTVIATTSHAFLTLAVGWPIGWVDVPEPVYASRTVDVRRFFPLWLLPMLTFLFVFRHWYDHGRDPKGRKTVVPEYAPPKGLRAAEMGFVWANRFVNTYLSAAIVELAVAGHIKIIEEVQERFGPDRKTFRFERLSKSEADLREWERALLQALFRGGAQSVTEDELKQHFVQDKKPVVAAIQARVVEQGYFVAHPARARTGWMIMGALAGFFGIELGSLPLLLTGVILLGFGWLMAKRTMLGVTVFDHAKGFKLFLGAAEKYRLEWQEKEGIFEKYLPYAMVFGVADKWAKAFAELHVEPVSPAWYVGASLLNFSATDFASRMGTLTQQMAVVSAPQGSGSGGGGFSGGGFGGGGGGSW